MEVPAIVSGGKKKLLTCSFSTTYMAMGSSPCSPDEMIVITGKNVAAPAIGSLGDCCGGPSLGWHSIKQVVSAGADIGTYSTSSHCLY